MVLMISTLMTKDFLVTWFTLNWMGKTFFLLFFALTLQEEAFVWSNDASAHSQTVAKAKYNFLFGSDKERPSGMGK